ncbi:ABC transporter ATP-binding protein [Candidatus Pelagibacter sp.]|uniref:ABC transporter ATP-binding protein n=1 Tax=Candidatus Pelagibacter sp. TaxID=2024849 RepID=UPI003F8452BF
MKSIPQLTAEVWSCLNKKRKKSLVLVSFLMILASFSEAFSIGAVLPFLAVLTNPEKIFENEAAAPFIDFFQIETPGDLLLPSTIIFSSAALASGIVRLLLLWVQTKVSWSIGSDFTVKAYEKTLYQPYISHISRNSSEILEGTVKARELIGTIIQPILTIIGSLIITLVVLSVLFAINAAVTFSAFVGIASIYLLILKITRKKINKNSKVIAVQQNKLTQSIQEGLGAIRDVIIDRSQNFYKTVYSNAFLPYKISSASNQFVSYSPRFGIEALGIVLIATLAYLLTAKGGLTNESNTELHNSEFFSAIPILGTLALGAQRLLPLLQQLFAAFNTIRSHRASIEDALDLLHQPLSQDYKITDIKKISFLKQIEFKNVSFKYNETLPSVFDNINLTIPKGSKVGFIGKTGSGKSTFLDLTMGLLQPSTGEILIDDIKINNLNCSSWQSHISHVPQDIYLADTSIAENIALGIPDKLVDMKKVYQAAENAEISDYIKRLPFGYETKIGERGVKLSGGQKQRIGIARAFYKKSSIIVLDEATSALDNETENIIINSIEMLGDELTVLIVTHRVSTLKFCDFIFKIENNRIKSIEDRSNIENSL